MMHNMLSFNFELLNYSSFIEIGFGKQIVSTKNTIKKKKNRKNYIALVRRQLGNIYNDYIIDFKYFWKKKK